MASKMSLSIFIVMTSATFVLGQRPFFAGSRPIGFPETPNRTTTEGIVDRFGEGTTQRLPIEANGDRDLIDRLSKLPIDNQPFWFINWQALEAHRQNPQTYPQRPSGFVDPPLTINANPNTGNVNSNSSLGNRFGNDKSNATSVNTNAGIYNSTAPVNSGTTVSYIGTVTPVQDNSHANTKGNESSTISVLKYF